VVRIRIIFAVLLCLIFAGGCTWLRSWNWGMSDWRPARGGEAVNYESDKGFSPANDSNYADGQPLDARHGR
jgi:hypothetical protein